MAVVNLEGVWLHDPADPAGTAHQFRFNGDGAKETYEPVRVFTQYAGRKHPVVDWGEDVDHAVGFTIACENETGDLAALRELLDSRTTLCYRDVKARYLHGTLSTGGITDDWWGAAVELTFTATDFTPRPYTPAVTMAAADLTDDELEAITAAVNAADATLS